LCREGLSTGMSRMLSLHIWIVAALIPILDRLLTLERTLRLLTPRRPRRSYRGVAPEAISALVARRLERPRHMRRRACLRRSLVLYHFLRLAGIDAIFHVAVFPPSVDPKRLHAHSWITVGEACLCEPPKGNTVEILTYGTAANVGGLP